MMNDDQFNALRKAVENIQKTVDRIDRDLTEDRKDIASLNIRQGKIDEQMEEVMGMFAKQTRKIADAVEDKIEEVIKEGGD